DGDPSTATADYLTWVISIDDTNDANHNGIPDFSDDPTAPPPQGPNLSLNRSSGQLLLGVTGTAGQSYTLQQTTTLSPTAWQPAGTVTITNSAQNVALPIPTVQTSFCRLKTP